MGVVVRGNIYVGGLYVGNKSESKREIKDGTFDASYDVQRKYVLKTKKEAWKL